MEKKLSLQQLSIGEQGIVKAVCVSGRMRRRLMDVGLIAGTTVECLGRSPLGDPSAYLVRGSVIALRAVDSQAILLQTETEGWV